MFVLFNKFWILIFKFENLTLFYSYQINYDKNIYKNNSDFHVKLIYFPLDYYFRILQYYFNIFLVNTPMQ